MTRSERRIHAAITLALATGIGASACSPVRGTPPDDLEQICDGDFRDDLVFNTPIDFYAQRWVESYEGVIAQQDTSYSRGEPCATATDTEACLQTLSETWPQTSTESGCGDTLEGCWTHGIVTTSGDDVRLYEPVSDAAVLILPVESVGDALFAASAAGYSAECDSVVQHKDGGWRMAAIRARGDCPIIHHFVDIEVAVDGTTTVLRERGSEDTQVCVGRRPDGLLQASSDCQDAVGEHLAHIAWLEGAAVHAFERLVSDLVHHNAPAQLIARAKRAIVDEVDHAARVGALANRYGATVPQVEVEAHADRSLFDVVLENAVEGCVRETYGVVDALYRSQHAQDPDVRSLFARIAQDETRHAALSWDIAAWAQQHLSAHDRERITAAAAAAHKQLGTQLATRRADTVHQVLGAPSPQIAVAMARSLQEQLAA